MVTPIQSVNTWLNFIDKPWGNHVVFLRPGRVLFQYISMAAQLMCYTSNALRDERSIYKAEVNKLNNIETLNMFLEYISMATQLMLKRLLYQ